MQLNENRVREYAYKIWESEGKPDGCAEKHWELALKTIEAEEHGSLEAESQDSLDAGENHSDVFIPHQNTKKGKHAHHPHQPH